jgi:RES domain-containing protein
VSELLVWRLCAEKYLVHAFDGEGARLYGGRWSQRGLPLSYCAESRALAVVEVLANADEPTRLTNIAWRLVPAVIPESLIEKPARYPDAWRTYPYDPATQEFGSLWAEQLRSVALRVPSAVVPGEFNYLLNAKHPDFRQLQIGDPEVFAFDARLVG